MGLSSNAGKAMGFKSDGGNMDGGVGGGLDGVPGGVADSHRAQQVIRERGG